MTDDGGMHLADFHVGIEFTMDDRIYRCTDIGTRTVVAIRIDHVETCTKHEDGTLTRTVLSAADAEAGGWFDGPPYAVLEHVIDEDDLPVCLPRILP